MASRRPSKPVARRSPGQTTGSERPLLPPPRGPGLRFLATFLLLLVGFYLAARWPLLGDRLFRSYLDATASAGAWTIRLFGGDAQGQGAMILSPAFAMEIRKGCDAIEPMALLVAGVIAAPVAWRKKLAGVAVGVSFLLVCNLVRITTLFFCGMHAPRLFEMLHLDVWQALFVFLAIGCWLAWAFWAARPAREPSHAAD